MQAITKSAEGRLTLAQIYDWMIANVPYFGQRSDSTSSAGWKVHHDFFFNVPIFLFQNSIRHNLSLHQRFLKVQNEGAGKSSWWTLNPERKLGAKPRRRTSSGETRSLQQRRERTRRRSEAHRLAAGEAFRTAELRAYSRGEAFPSSRVLVLPVGYKETREPVSSRLEGLSLDQEENRHRIKVRIH